MQTLEIRQRYSNKIVACIAFEDNKLKIRRAASIGIEQEIQRYLDNGFERYLGPLGKQKRVTAEPNSIRLMAALAVFYTFMFDFHVHLITDDDEENLRQLILMSLSDTNSNVLETINIVEAQWTNLD